MRTAKPFDVRSCVACADAQASGLMFDDRSDHTCALSQPVQLLARPDGWEDIYRPNLTTPVTTVTRGPALVALLIRDSANPQLRHNWRRGRLAYTVAKMDWGIRAMVEPLDEIERGTTDWDSGYRNQALLSAIERQQQRMTYYGVGGVAG